jgi:hypothetical protein
MRFTSNQDYQLFLHFNQELINEFIDVPVVLYKLNVVDSKKNIYGESSSKKWYQGVQLPVLVDRDFSTTVKDAQSINVEQTAQFHFLRQECIDKNVYPERGDIISYNNLYFEIDNINENQLIGAQPIHNFTISAASHLTRVTNLQLDPPIV